MSGLELLVDDIDNHLHCAVVRKGKMIDLYTDRVKTGTAWASIYLGKVTKIDKYRDAAIVDLGNGLSGFLPAKHVHFPEADASEARTGIADLLKPGQMVMVQIKSEARKGSQHEQHKLPRLTTKIYIIGQFLVYCPSSQQVTMSRHIVSEEIIAVTAKLKGKGGWIVQQNADIATAKEVVDEAEKLENLWEDVRARKSDGADEPRLLQAGPNALERILNDYAAKSFDHIHVANKNLLSAMTTWCEKHDPPLATSKRLRLFKPEKQGQRLFDLDDLYTDLESLPETLVHLPSGGSLIIETTHALVVIDVNQGSASGILSANVEAAEEIARQIRLRNLSGAIIIDFIGMAQRSERARLLDVLEHALVDDAAGATCHGFTRIGIIEITRKRRCGMLLER